MDRPPRKPHPVQSVGSPPCRYTEEASTMGAGPATFCVLLCLSLCCAVHKVAPEQWRHLPIHVETGGLLPQDQKRMFCCVCRRK